MEMPAINNVSGRLFFAPVSLTIESAMMCPDESGWALPAAASRKQKKGINKTRNSFMCRLSIDSKAVKIGYTAKMHLRC